MRNSNSNNNENLRKPYTADASVLESTSDGGFDLTVTTETFHATRMERVDGNITWRSDTGGGPWCDGEVVAQATVWVYRTWGYNPRLELENLVSQCSGVSDRLTTAAKRVQAAELRNHLPEIAIKPVTQWLILDSVSECEPLRGHGWGYTLAAYTLDEACGGRDDAVIVALPDTGRTSDRSSKFVESLHMERLPNHLYYCHNFNGLPWLVENQEQQAI